jgi:hypothetical protein
LRTPLHACACVKLRVSGGARKLCAQRVCAMRVREGLWARAVVLVYVCLRACARNDLKKSWKGCRPRIANTGLAPYIKPGSTRERCEKAHTDTHIHT